MPVPELSSWGTPPRCSFASPFWICLNMSYIFQLLNVVLNNLKNDFILNILESIDWLFYLLWLLYRYWVITRVDFLDSSLIKRSPTETKLKLKYSVIARANSRTLDPGGPIMNIFFSKGTKQTIQLHSGSLSFFIRKSIGSSGFFTIRDFNISSKIA